MSKAVSDKINAEDFDAAPVAAPESTPELDARYGRTASDNRVRRTILIAVGAVFAVVLVAWVVWGSLTTSTSGIEGRDISHTIDGDHGGSVTFQVTAPKNTPVYCVLEALNDDFTVVGSKTVAIEPSETPIRMITEHVVTTEIPSTVTTTKCSPFPK